MDFCAQLLLLSIIFSRFIHIVACINTLLFFIAKYSIVRTDHIIFIYSSAEGNSDPFHFLAILNNAAMNICVQVFVWVCVFISLKYIYIYAFVYL